MARFRLEAGETQIRTERGMVIRGKMRGYSGVLTLTDRRLMFRRVFNPLLGLIGALIPPLRGGTMFDLALDRIASVERGKHGRNDRVILVGDAEGNTHKVIVSKTVDEWIAAIRERTG